MSLYEKYAFCKLCSTRTPLSGNPKYFTGYYHGILFWQKNATDDAFESPQRVRGTFTDSTFDTGPKKFVNTRIQTESLFMQCQKLLEPFAVFGDLKELNIGALQWL